MNKKIILSIFSVLCITCCEFGDQSPVVVDDISEILEKNPALSRFYINCKELGLASLLKDNTDLTVFAPTNEAFSQLPGNLLDHIGGMLQKSSEDILRYHIIRALLDSADIASGGSFLTYAGPSLFFSSREDSLFVNREIQITTAGIPADNGFLHIIDAVLLPPVPENILSTNSINNQEVYNQLVIEYLATGVSQSFYGEYDIFATNNMVFSNDYLSQFTNQILQTSLSPPNGLTLLLDKSDQFKLTHGVYELAYIIFKDDRIIILMSDFE